MYWIAVGFIALAICGSIGMLVMNTTVGIDLLASRTETTRRLEMAVEAVSARLGAPAGMAGVFAPRADTTSTSYSILPASAGVIPTTANGRFLVYCPYAPGSTSLLPSPDTHYQLGGSSYQSSSQDGYVIASGPPPAVLTNAGMQVLAILIAPKGQDNPRCQDVTLTNGQPTVPGGLVRVVTRTRGQLQAQTLESRAYEVYVSPTGGGDGRSASTPTSLTSAIDTFYALRPRSMVIRLADGAYTASTIYRGAQVDGNSRGSRLSLVTTDNNAANGSPTFTGSASIDMQVDLTLVGVNFAPTTDIWVSSNSSITAVDVGFGGLNVYPGSRVAIQGTSSARFITVSGDLAIDGNFSYAATQPFRVQPGGNAVIAGSALFAGSFSGNSSTIEVRGKMAFAPQFVVAQTVSNSAEAAIRVIGTGVLQVQGPSQLLITAPSPAASGILVAGGHFELGAGASIYGTAGSLVTSMRGGALTLNGASLNAGPTRALETLQILDVAPLSGAMTISAGSTGRCHGTYGSTVNILPALTAGQTFAVAADTAFTDPTPGDPVTSTDLTNDAARQALNVQRARQRQLFAAAWGCSA